MGTRKYRLLLVADDAALQRVVAELLADLPVRLLLAPDGTKAINIIGQQSLDLTLADAHLPDMSGINVLEAVQAAHPHSIRILLTTYADFASAAREVNRAGLHRVLLKPLESHYFRSVVRQSLDALHGERERLRLQSKLSQVNKLLQKELLQRTRDAQKYHHDLIQTRQELERTFWELMHLSRFSTVGLMAGVIAHDIRNPLTVLSGQLQILAKRGQDDGFACRCATMMRQVDRIQELVDSVSTLAQNEIGTEPSFHPVQAVAEALSLTRKLFAAKGVTLEFRPPQKTLLVRGNLGHGVHILYKLLEFIGQRVSDGRVGIEIKCARRQVRILIRFPETGIASQLGRIMAIPYPRSLLEQTKLREQAPAEAATFFLCSRILDQVGGNLRVVESGGETIFSISYPLAEGDATRTKTAAKAPASA